MNTTVQSRLIAFIESIGLTKAKFEKMVGASNGYISHIRKTPTQEMVDKFCEIFPELDRDWLLYGDGPGVHPADPKGFKARLLEVISDKNLSQASFSRSCGISYAYVTNLEGLPRYDILQKIFKTYPDVSRTWLLSGVGTMHQDERLTEDPVTKMKELARYYKDIADKQERIIHNMEEEIEHLKVKIDELKMNRNE